MMDKYFDYRKHKTDFKTEVIAGVSTFLTMAYIMFLILSYLLMVGLTLAEFSQQQPWQLPWHVL